jgi:hypothetical protein
MVYFVVNRDFKQVYRLNNWRETFDEVMDANPGWSMQDDIDCYDDDPDVIESYLKLNYKTNLGVYELTQYIRDPEYLVWYMDAHGFGLYDISRAINVWDGEPESIKAHAALNKVAERQYMGVEDDDVTMLCKTMNKVM